MIQKDQPYTPEETQKIIEQFNRDGYYFLGPVLNSDEVEDLRDAMIRKRNDPRILADEEGDHMRGRSLMRMFEYDYAFRDLTVREPFVSLAEAILGEDCHVMSQNALYTDPGVASGNWHVDDLVHFPLSDDVSHHDPRIVMPCFVLQIFTPLTDVDSIEYGPTQVVPGSHYAGRRPATQEQPTFEGRGAVSIFAKAGDGYMFHNQMLASRGGEYFGSNPIPGRRHLQQAVHFPAVLSLYRLPDARARFRGGGCAFAASVGQAQERVIWVE